MFFTYENVLMRRTAPEYGLHIANYSLLGSTPGHSKVPAEDIQNGDCAP